MLVQVICRVYSALTSSMSLWICHVGDRGLEPRQSRQHQISRSRLRAAFCLHGEVIHAASRFQTEALPPSWHNRDVIKRKVLSWPFCVNHCPRLPFSSQCWRSISMALSQRVRFPRRSLPWRFRLTSWSGCPWRSISSSCARRR